MALRMSPIPPSSPAIKMPGTFVSKFELTCGISTPRDSVPNTSVMASAGQAFSQAPWPMQFDGPTRRALPRIMPSTGCAYCSGHAATQERQPMHLTGSIIGCSDGGSVMLRASASSAALMLSFSLRRRPSRYKAKMPRTGTRYRISKTGFMDIEATGSLFDKTHKKGRQTP